MYIPVCLAEDMGGSVEDCLGGPVGRTYLCTWQKTRVEAWRISWADLLGVHTCVLGRRHGWKRGGFLGRTCWAYIPVYLAEDMGGSVEDFLGGSAGSFHVPVVVLLFASSGNAAICNVKYGRTMVRTFRIIR